MPHAEGDEIVPGFRLMKFLGRGGIGEVWKATAPGKMFCALKIINLSAKQGRTEYRAVKLVKNIHHPHLVPMTGIWLKDRKGKLLGDEPRGDPLRDSMAFQAAEEAPAQMIIQMGLGDESLHDRLMTWQRKGQQGIPPDELLDYMEEAAKGIDFLNTARHDLGRGLEAISHGDIKPQNIMLVGGSAQVCDFGLARSLGGDVRATSITGSPAYGSPESLSSGKNVPSSDQYSLAISYFELRTGQLPFDDESYFSVIAAHTKGKLNLQALPSAERAVIARATALEPAARYESCVKMVRELRRAYEGSIAQASVVILAEPSGASAAAGGAPASVVVTPPPRSVLETGRELLPHLKLVRRMFKVGVDEIWEATSSNIQTTLFIRDLAPPAAPPDLRTLALMSKLEHPHLARLLSFWLFDLQLTPVGVEASSLKDAAWLVLSERRVERTLGDRLEECRAEGLDGIPPDELLGHMLGAAQAIDYLNAMRHEIGSTRVAVQHGHVRPSSLELHTSGEGSRVRLGNFTHAKILDAETILVPPIAADAAHAYLPPERIDGTLSRWSDQFSLGVTYYHLRTGLPPHSPADLMAARIDPKQLPAPEANVLLRATSFDLEQRYESCTEFVTLLGAAIGRATRQRLGRAVEPPKETGSLLAPGPLPLALSPAPVETAKPADTPASESATAETKPAAAAPVAAETPAASPVDPVKKKKRKKLVEDDAPPLELTSTIEFNEAFRRMLSDSGPLAPLNLRAGEAKAPAAAEPTPKAAEPEPAKPALRTNSDWRARLKKGKAPHPLNRNLLIVLAFIVAAVLLLFVIWLFSGPKAEPEIDAEAALANPGHLVSITLPTSSPPFCPAFHL